MQEEGKPYGGLGYRLGKPTDFDRTYAVDLALLLEFLRSTQPSVVEAHALDEEGPSRLAFLNRLQGEIEGRGIVDVLRRPVKHGPSSVTMFYGSATAANAEAIELFKANIFSVTPQLRYSKDETKLALDLCLFVNGLPIATFELKNSLTKQTVEDAVEQYKKDRDPKELLFHAGRCAVHFAVDDQEVRMCTELKGKASWFLPLNLGWNDGAGNPPNPDGLKTDYLWTRLLSKESLTDILENFAHRTEEKDAKGRTIKKQIFPRYHQLDLVRKLLADAKAKGAGQKYLIQHSAGSGKSNSITWLAQQMVGLESNGQQVFDSIIVVTDRVLLDRHIHDNIKLFTQVKATIGHAEHSGDLRKFLQSGKKIVITTVQKFPFILKEIGDEHRAKKFAIIIDEAHSSQGGRTAAQMNVALAENAIDPEHSIEDRINELMEAKKMLGNASYFAFTATPKNKTLEVFGVPYQQDGVVKHRPFHSYTMKQAIEESFILDVLRSYTPVDSYYKLTTIGGDDPEYDVKKARKKLRHFVESKQESIRAKAEIMVDHFHEQVIDRHKIGGKARAMVVTSGIQRAIQYFQAFGEYLAERKSPYKAIVAFSGEHEYGGKKVTEATLNGFPSIKIPEKLIEEPYRFLICADKFQTGYDEPLLHTMYVDKPLSGIKAVQTLSRLNRAHPDKRDTFVLDFMNDSETIELAFADYYRTTILSGETDANKLHDLKYELDGAQVYSPEDVDELVRLYVGNAERDKLDPILDACAATYVSDLDEDGQVSFKGNAKAFVRSYGFLSSILPYTNIEWEKLATFLNFLIPKLPAPKEEDLSQGVLDSVDMDSYRVEVRTALKLVLPDENAELEPVPAGSTGAKYEPEMDYLSNIVKTFNSLWGNIDWKDEDKILKVISEEIPEKVAADKAYQNAVEHSDKQNARIELESALLRIVTDMVSDHTELYKQYGENPGFRKWLSDEMFAATYSR